MDMIDSGSVRAHDDLLCVCRSKSFSVNLVHFAAGNLFAIRKSTVVHAV